MNKTIITCDKCGAEIPENTKYWVLGCNYTQWGELVSGRSAAMVAPLNPSKERIDLCDYCFSWFRSALGNFPPSEKEGEI